ncbi:hypothetical protein F4814DRAFT_439621 [Daldinia grandis]|nr:hypothetical protein F4814DRAFT_439621 [Daldinia grandis]
MSIEVAMNTPLADALNMAIQPKLVEVGWASGGADDSALSEYIILMLVNGKTEDQIAAELAGDLLSLGPDDPGARDFARWLFDQIESLNSQLNGAPAQLGNNSAGAPQNAPSSGEQDTDMTMSLDGPELNAPTGPRSMRNPNMRGNREKRMLGQMSKAMDRSHDNVLHRVRGNGNERINAHRAPPTGPRGGFGRTNNRAANNRAAGFAAHLGQAGGALPNMHDPNGMPNLNNDMNWMMSGGGTPEQLFQLLQQQNHMMGQMYQQLTQQTQPNGRPNGRSLFDRVQTPRGGRRGGHANGHKFHQGDGSNVNETDADNEDVDMTQAKRELPSPETVVCKFNLSCTNRDCKFAHQSPAASPNTTVDVNDVCSYGAACKNRKCVGRHPSPATRRAHQNEQECKFYPNCTNPNCPFKHPDMPPCRNGGDCAVEGCKFAHLQTMCKYKPCTNRFCPYKHDEGQRGTFQDKVWTADGTREHVSERKFVDADGLEELLVPGGETESGQAAAAATDTIMSAYRNARYGPPTRISTSPASRQLSSLVAPSCLLHSSIRKQVACSRSGKLPRARSQTFATANTHNGKTREIAVLGGGITGLTTAHYLARHAKNAHITVYDASNKFGGWVSGNLVSTNDKSDKILLQSGPRMLRSGPSPHKYDSLVLYDVLINLGIEHKLLGSRGPPPARYIYYPDHLVRLPGSELTPDNILDALHSYFTEPLWDGALKSLFNLYLLRGRLPNSSVDDDESVGEFLGRLFNDDRLVKNIISGMMHGIYGGDVYKLSAKHTLFDTAWRWLRHARNPGTVLVEGKEPVLLHSLMNSPNRDKIRALISKAGSTTMGFEDGLLTLSDSLIKDLKNQKNVTIKPSSQVTSLKYESGQVQYDQVISTIFSRHLAGLVKPKHCLPSLEDTYAVTIMVVNLWFPTPDLLRGKRGFGYLVPTTTPDNDECLLGVLFDSEIEMRSERPGTKLTVMLGGHYWDGWTQYPTEEMGRAMALQAVQRHLGIPVDEEPISYVRLCRECLPQHYVGHRERMSAAHYELLAAFHGRLTVAGPSYTSIGVMPAMRAGFEAAMRVAHGRGPPWFEFEDSTQNWSPPLREFAPFNNGIPDHVGATGLEGFTELYSDTLVCVKDSPGNTTSQHGDD